MEWIRDDITFCLNKFCPYTKCMRHLTNVPTTHPYSASLFFPQIDGSCKVRFDSDWLEGEVRPIGE